MKETTSTNYLIVKVIALGISLGLVFWAIHALRDTSAIEKQLPDEPISAKVQVTPPASDHK